MEKGTIFIIDDDSTTIERLKDEIELTDILSNVEIKTYEKPFEFLKYSTDQKLGDYDIMIIDYSMPEMNGDELILEIRKMYPDEKPFIFLYSGNISHLSSIQLDELTRNKVITISKTKTDELLTKLIDITNMK